MTWSTFTIYLIVAYIAYYTLNILFDLLKKPANADASSETLHITGDVETIEVDDPIDEHAVISANNAEGQTDITQANQFNNSNQNLKEEEKNQPETTTHDSHTEIPPEAGEDVSTNGGVSIRELARLKRKDAIHASSRIAFAS